MTLGWNLRRFVAFEICCFSAKTVEFLCLQTMMLVDQLRRLTANKPRIQLLLCGDFNSLPDSGM